MSNIWRLFVDDLGRLHKNLITIIIVLGLVLIPSIFSWYNILASWDVFGSTGNLKVAVANTDEGYESDLVPLKMNLGEQVVSALRANDQLKWEFTTEEDAVDGAKSGKYYAAVVIPASFSRDMMTFYSDDVEHAQLVYYTNEKKSAVAPRVTDQGADQVSYQVNKAFTQTLSEVALSVSSALSDYADDAGVDSRVGTLATHVDNMANQMTDTANVLTTYVSVLHQTRTLISGSSDLLRETKNSAEQVEGAANEGIAASSQITTALSDSSGALSQALHETRASYDGVSQSVDAVFTSTDTLSADSATSLRNQANSIDNQVSDYQRLITELKTLKGQVPPAYEATIQALIEQMESSVDYLTKLSTALNKAAEDIAEGNNLAQADYGEIKSIIAQAQQEMDAISTDYDDNIQPRLEQLSTQMGQTVASLSASAENLSGIGSRLGGSAETTTDQLGRACDKLNSTSADLTAAADKMRTLSRDLSGALASGDAETLRALLGSDPSTLAAALAAPIQLDRRAVFPADNFGSQMAPLYATLALWIGSLLMAVAIKVHVSRKALKNLDNPKLYQLFLGRFGIFAVLSLLQSTVMAVGNMFFLGVQVSEPLLYLLCFWVSGLVFTFIIYTLVVSFANLGKAIAVLLLIIQVTSGGGSFPLQMLPDFFQVVSQYLPATHVINAMRAAMMGLYQGDFWIEMGELLLFVVPFLLLGLVLRKPLMKFMDWYIEKVEDSKLVA